RHLQNHACAVGAVTVLTHAVATRRALVVLLVAIIDQRVEAVGGLDPDVAATSAVAAVRTAILNEFLAPERDAAGAAVAGAHVDFRLVQELHNAPYMAAAPLALNCFRVANAAKRVGRRCRGSW